MQFQARNTLEKTELNRQRTESGSWGVAEGRDFLSALTRTWLCTKMGELYYT